MRKGRPPHPELLTPREQEVLGLLREGLSNQEIAHRLGISRAGAAYHVGEILSKLQVSSRQEAASLEDSVAQRRTWFLPAIMPFVAKLREVSLMKVSSAAAIAVGIGAFVLLAVGVGLTLLNDENPPDLDCVAGEEAQNPVSSGGRELPISGLTLDTISEGESFICLDVPQLAEVNGWYVALVNAARSHSLSRFQPGEFTAGDDGYRFLAIGYLNPQLDGLIMFDFTVYPVSYLERLSNGDLEATDCAAVRLPFADEMELLEEDSARVAGQDASFKVYADRAERGASRNLIVCWQEGDLIYSAYARYGNPLNYRSDILPFLELVE